MELKHTTSPDLAAKELKKGTKKHVVPEKHYTVVGLSFYKFIKRNAGHKCVH